MNVGSMVGQIGRVPTNGARIIADGCPCGAVVWHLFDYENGQTNLMHGDKDRYAVVWGADREIADRLIGQWLDRLHASAGVL